VNYVDLVDYPSVVTFNPTLVRVRCIRKK